MDCKNLKLALAVVYVSLSPLCVYADDTTKKEDTFQSTCVTAWLGRYGDIKEAVDYKNFGEKYCECASTQPLQDSAAVDKAAQVCMTRTLLHDAVDSMEEDKKLDNATAADIGEYCHDRWDLVYPKMDDKLKSTAATYCDCANPEILSLIKGSDSMTDKQYYDKIDEIAATCSAKLVAPASH